MINEKDPHKRGKAARNKGKNAELELAMLFRALGFPNVRRGHVFDHESDLVGVPFVHVECKRQQKINIYKFMEQAKEEAKKRRDGMPAVFFRHDRGEWLVCMRMVDICRLLRALVQVEGENDGE